jgi:hypothetical protein
MLLLSVDVGIMYFPAVENLLPYSRNDAGGPNFSSHLVIVFFNVTKMRILNMIPFCTPVALKESVPTDLLLVENSIAVDAGIIAWMDLFPVKPDFDDVNKDRGEFMARVKSGQFGPKSTEECSAPCGNRGVHAAEKMCLGVGF